MFSAVKSVPLNVLSVKMDSMSTLLSNVLLVQSIAQNVSQRELAQLATLDGLFLTFFQMENASSAKVLVLLVLNNLGSVSLVSQDSLEKVGCVSMTLTSLSTSLFWLTQQQFSSKSAM